MVPSIEQNGIEVCPSYDDNVLNLLYHVAGNTIGHAHFFRKNLYDICLDYDRKKEIMDLGFNQVITSSIAVNLDYRGQGYSQDLWLQAELKRLEVWKDLTLRKTSDQSLQLDVDGKPQFTGWTGKHFPKIFLGLAKEGYYPEIIFQNDKPHQRDWFVWRT